MPADALSAGFVVDLAAYRKPRKGGWHGVNTWQQFNKILVRAGIGLIKNAFKVFRSSCVTNWARDHAVHVVAGWAGHTVAVAGKHYLTLTDSDSVKAKSFVITLNPTLSSTVPGISQGPQVVDVPTPGNPENPVPQKVTLSAQEMARNDGDYENN